jgi:tetratricopeptide (TPR) repeat protein
MLIVTPSLSASQTQLADTAQIHIRAGNALMQQGGADGAIAEYRTAVQLEPENVVAHAGLVQALFKIGDKRGAILESREILRLKPSIAPDDRSRAVLHFSHAIVLHSFGDFDIAIEDYQAAIRLNPAYPEAHKGLGQVFLHKGNLDGAIVELKESARLKPEDAQTHRNLGSALFLKRNLDDALTELGEAIRLEPKNPDGHLFLANVYRAKSMQAEAAQEYDKFLKLRPNTPGNK